MNRMLKPLVFFGSSLYPLYTLPWVIKYMLKNDNLGYILFSFFMGLLAYTMIPYDTMDITRHYEAFEDISKVNISEVFDYGRVFDYSFNLYMWTIHYIGLPKEFVPFSFIFIQIMFYFLSLKIVIHYSFSNREVPLWFMGLSLFLILNEIRFIGAASGLRNGLAFSIFIYAQIEYFFAHKRLKFFLLSLLSMLMHMSVIPIFFLTLIATVFRLKTIGKFLFFLSLILLMSGQGSKIFYAIIHILEPFLRSVGLYFHAYMDPDGAWGTNFYADQNMKTIILEKLIKPLPFYLAGIYLLWVKDFKNIYIQNYLYYAYIFIALVSASRTMLDRYSYYFVLFFILFFLSEISSKGVSKLKKIFIAIFISSLLLMDAGGLAKYRDIIIYWKSFFYTPAPFLFLQDIEPKDYIHRESL